MVTASTENDILASCKSRGCLEERMIEFSCQIMLMVRLCFSVNFLAVSYTISNVCKVSLEEFVFVSRTESDVLSAGTKGHMQDSKLMSALL